MLERNKISQELKQEYAKEREVKYKLQKFYDGGYEFYGLDYENSLLEELNDIKTNILICKML